MLSLCYDLQNTPYHLNPLSFLREKKKKVHYSTEFQTSVTATSWNPQFINLPQPGGKGPSGSFSADNIEAYLKTRQLSVRPNIIHIIFSVCSKMSTSPEDHSFWKKPHHAIFNLVLQRNLDYMIIRYGFCTLVSNASYPPFPFLTANLSTHTKRCSSHKFWGSMYQQINTKFLLREHILP